MRLVLLGLLCAASLASANPISNPTDPTDPSLPMPLPERHLAWYDVNVLHTTDIHGRISGRQKQNYPEKSWSADLGDFKSFVSHMRDLAKIKEAALLVVDTGDIRVGSGFTDLPLAGDEEDGRRKIGRLYKDVGYDLVIPGNKDLEDEYARELMMEPEWRDMWGDRFITSNVRWKGGKGSACTLGAPFRRLDVLVRRERKHVLAFGVTTANSLGDKLEIQSPKDMVQEPWFKETIDPKVKVDLFILLAHMDPGSSDIKLIHDVVREKHKEAPIMIFTGHTHKRSCKTFEPKGEPRRSMAIQSGRYFDTVGWMSVQFEPLKFSRRFLDNNVLTYKFHSCKEDDPNFDEPGRIMKQDISEINEKLGLDKVIGSLDSNFYRDRKPWRNCEDTSSIYDLYLDAVESLLINHEASRGWLFVSHWKALRDDLYKGDFTMGDWYTISEDGDKQNTFQCIDVASKDAEKLFEYLQPNREIEGRRLNTGIFGNNDQSPLSFSSCKSGLTEGWVTKDSCGEGRDDPPDDAAHCPIPGRINLKKQKLYFWRKKGTDTGNRVSIIFPKGAGQQGILEAVRSLEITPEPCQCVGSDSTNHKPCHYPIKMDMDQRDVFTEYIRLGRPRHLLEACGKRGI